MFRFINYLNYNLKLNFKQIKQFFIILNLTKFYKFYKFYKSQAFLSLSNIEFLIISRNIITHRLYKQLKL